MTKMGTILQTTCWNAFSSKKIVVFLFKFNLDLFSMIQFTLASIYLDKGMVPDRWHAFIWTNDGKIYKGIYVSLGLGESIGKIYYH